MTRTRRAPAVAIIAACAALVPLPVPAGAHAAADEFSWTVQPSGPKGPSERSQFAYDLRPGQRIDDHVAITNLSKAPLTLTAYATDAATTADGAFTLLPASQSAGDAGRWIALPRKAYTVKPGKRLILPFRLTVPKGASPGDHAAGVIASVTERRADGSGQQVNVDRRVAARVYLRVIGPVLPAVQITAVRTEFDNPVLPFTRGAATVTYRVRNAGNVRVGGPVTVRATGLFGVGLSGERRRQLPDLLPGVEVELTDRIDGVLPAAMITGAVSLDAQSSEGPLPTRAASATVWSVPWTALLLAALVALAAFRRIRSRRASGARPGRSGSASTGPASAADAGVPAPA